MRFSARKLGCLAAACLLAGLLPASCRRGQGKQPAVEILVIDSFVLSEHGRTVRGIAEDWSLGTCPIQEFDVELPERDGYLNNAGGYLGAAKETAARGEDNLLPR